MLRNVVSGSVSVMFAVEKEPLRRLHFLGFREVFESV
jgi:hypothetical protein